MVINQHSKEKELKRKILIQKSFNNKKISFKSIIEMINKNLSLFDEKKKKSLKEDEIYLVR